jgi:DNA-binding response OmpR family regulator/two-component sensor histidine kinase
LSEVQLSGRRLYVAAIRDISERKRIDRMKTEFVSTVSHELRTPLTSIAGSLGLLAGGLGGELPPQASRLIKIARRNSERLVRLINDILDIEKIESGRMTFDMKPVPLQALVAGVIEANKSYAEEYGVRAELITDVTNLTVSTDSDRLVQVVTNLLSNAIKFSPTGGVVRIGIERHGQEARLSVRDEGPGIPEEFKSRIFSKFAQADSSDARQKGGTGLGLSIAKEIVECLSGRLSFQTCLGAGTTFYVDLPLAETLEDAPAAVVERRALLYSGNRVLRNRARTVLAEAGILCDLAEDEDAALQQLRGQKYLAILVDVAPPGGTSISLVRALRLREEATDVPIFLLGPASQSEAQEAAAEALPIIDWLNLPLDEIRLTGVLRRTFCDHEGRRPLLLHVDDDPDVRILVKKVFQDMAEVQSAATLAEARNALDIMEPDLVILDLMLAEGSGLQLLPKLKTRTGRSIPVIIFSAQDADPDLAAKVEAVLMKSRISLRELADTVLSVIGLKPLSLSGTRI